jgi:hypothetical protein
MLGCLRDRPASARAGSGHRGLVVTHRWPWIRKNPSGHPPQPEVAEDSPADSCESARLCLGCMVGCRLPTRISTFVSGYRERWRLAAWPRVPKEQKRFQLCFRTSSALWVTLPGYYQYSLLSMLRLLRIIGILRDLRMLRV